MLVLARREFGLPGVRWGLLAGALEGAEHRPDVDCCDGFPSCVRRNEMRALTTDLDLGLQHQHTKTCAASGSAKWRVASQQSSRSLVARQRRCGGEAGLVTLSARQCSGVFGAQFVCDGSSLITRRTSSRRLPLMKLPRSQGSPSRMTKTCSPAAAVGPSPFA